MGNSAHLDVRSQVRDLVMRHGWNETCYQTVNPVFEYSFFPQLDGMVAYVRARGRRVVAGAPICPLKNLDEVINRFSEQERSRVIYFGAGQRVNLALRRQPKHGIVSLGAQPIWNPELWSKRVLTRSSLRYQFRRAKHKGVVIREWSTEQAEGSQALRSVLQDWLGRRGLPPLHFLVEPETLDYLRDRRTFVAEVDEKPVAFLNLCPVPQRNGWLTEQFPRRNGSPNGTVDLLMHEAAQKVASEGANFLSMGLVPFSSHGEMQQNPGWLQTVMGFAKRAGTPLYSFQGLDEFKSKFMPDQWEPVYAAVNGRSFRFSDLLAIMEAFTGESILRTGLKVVSRVLRQASESR